MNNRLKLLWYIARKDEAFQKMEQSFSRLEKLFSETVSELSPKQQDIIWAYVMKSNEIDQYIMKIMMDLVRLSEKNE